MKRILLLALLGLLFGMSMGCDRNQPSAPAQPGKMVTTPAYEKYFGPAPASGKGSCIAFVIYFPSAKEPGKVVPFPFFTFDEATLKKLAVERLLGGMDIGSYKGEFLKPFPTGIRLVSISEASGVVTLTMSREFGGLAQTKAGESALRAIVLTLRQFKGTSNVRVKVEGVVVPIEVQADEKAILLPGPPRLLSVTAMKEKGKDVEEVSAFFDRPVDVKLLQMTGKDGKLLEGDTFLSVFDMAVVMKPRETSMLKAGLPIRVRWKVADKLGREAGKDEVRPLEVKVHEQ
jgi:germination protein M